LPHIERKVRARGAALKATERPIDTGTAAAKGLMVADAAGLARALMQGDSWRVALWRDRYRQVSTDSSVVRPLGYGAAYAPAVFLLTATTRSFH